MLSRKAGNALDIILSFYFFRGKISSYYEREVTIMMILALVAVTALIVEMDYMEYRDRR